MSSERARVAVVGAGYWGINHVRSFAREPRCQLTWVCDGNDDALSRAKHVAGDARTTSSIDDVLGAGDVHAVVLATPAVTHAELAHRVIASGRHLLVEKPLALSVADAESVVTAADAAGVALMVGHLMLYHPVVERLRALLDDGAFGDIYYMYAQRVNFGRLRRDENALWSFAPHDISMIDYLMRTAPVSVAARGECYLQEGVQDVVFVSLKFPGGPMAHVHLSWLNPRKERRLTVVGSRKMAEFDDVSAEKLRIYDKGYDRPPEFTEFDQYLTMRHGDVHIPHVPMEEPLAVEARRFVECILDGAVPASGGSSALRVVRILAAAQRSLDRDGAPVGLDGDGND